MSFAKKKDTIGSTVRADRNLALDAVRGFALLGILMINIQSFSMIDEAYLNPNVYGDQGEINLLCWTISHVVVELKCITLFSLLFGASILLFTDRIEARGDRSVGIYYRRIFWLIVFGMLHAYLLWHGDVLVSYGFCALIVYFFRKAPSWVLLILGLFGILVPSLVYAAFQWSLSVWNEATLAEVSDLWLPSPERIDEIHAAYRGGWSEQMSQRVPLAFTMQTFSFLMMVAWRTAGLMLIGMVLYRWRVLTGERSDWFYVGCILTGLLIGFSMVGYGAHRHFVAGWSMEYSLFAGYQYNYWGSLFVSLGYIGLIMLAWRRRWMQGVIQLLANVGRTALSNYILQTVICTTLFYGHGFGLFGEVSRPGQFLIVVGIWIFQVTLTHFWLRHYRLGPLEWLWRTLTYLHMPPMRVLGGTTK